jgi:hypothetical protein
MIEAPTGITEITPTNCTLADSNAILAARANLLALQKNATSLLALKESQVLLGIVARRFTMRSIHFAISFFSF